MPTLKNALALVALAASALTIAACEEKKPETKPATLPAAVPAAKPNDAKPNDVKGGPNQSAKDALVGYVSELTNVNSALDKIKTPADLAMGIKSLADSTSKINGFAETLLKMTSEERTALIAGTKDALTSAVNTFKSNMDRLSKDPVIGKAMGEQLKKIKIVE